jgi:valyl-tRNA synthetase
MGSDALRFSLAALNTGGSYIKLSIDRVAIYRNFINKLWNASRFALMNFDGYDPERFEAQIGAPAGRAALRVPERWLLARLQATTGEVQAALEAYKFADAANAIWHFIYDDLCDWYIEIAKPHLRQSDDLVQDPQKAAYRHIVQGVLASTLETTMRLLHPFAPFVTEEIWQKLPKPQQLPESLMITVFPRADEAWRDAAAEGEIQVLQDVVTACRMLRQTYNVPPKQHVDVELRATDDSQRRTLETFKDFTQKIASVNATITSGGGSVAGAAKAIVSSTLEVVMPLGGLIDPKAEKSRLAKEIEKSRKEISIIETKLAKPEFIARAPEDEVAKQRSRLVEEQTMLTRLTEALHTVEAAQ